MRVSVILPTYNEAANVEPLARDIIRALSSHDVEVLVVDDDSPDGTWRVAGAMGPPVRVIRRTRDRGLTRALNEGILASQGSVVCWMDADFSMPPALLPELVSAVEQGADLVAGSRYVTGGSDGRENVPLHRVLSRVITGLAAALLVPSFRDYTSGFIAVRRDLLTALGPLRGDYGEYFIDLVYRAHRHGARIRELPYRCVPRRAGESKTATSVAGFARRGVGYLRTIARLRLAGGRP